MGNYVSREDIVNAVGGQERLTQLTDYDRDGTEDSGVVDDAIFDAEALIDSYARKVFSTPFVAPLPPIIVTMAKKLSVYNLRERRDVITDAHREEQEDRIKWLEHLASGKVDPGIAPAPKGSGHNRSTSTSRPSAKRVSRESLKGFS